MLEMTNGRVKTFPESYLGLRHGPMCAIDDDTLVVCFLARTERGARRVIVGHAVPAGLVGSRDLVVDGPALASVPDDDAPVVDVLVGQLLAAFRCLSLGLRPDLPSDDGVINRVVEEFALHPRR